MTLMAANRDYTNVSAEWMRSELVRRDRQRFEESDYIHHASLKIREKVFIDGFRDLKGIVTGILFRETRIPTYEVSWVHNGVATIAWVEQYRLESAE